MNAELEGLLLALDGVLQARSGDDANRLERLYQARLDQVLQRCPDLSRDALQKTVDLAYWRWCRAQQHPPSVPPKA
jgi:hypothetical protein